MTKQQQRKLDACRNIVVISDTHVGCKLALMHPNGAALDEGNVVGPSAFQLKIWAIWREFWDNWVPRSTNGEPFIVVHNGDVIDGAHHNATSQWSHNLKDQREHAELLLAPVVKACEGRYFHIRGTEAHVGQSGCEEESLAKSLGAIPGPTGQYARWELLKKLGPYLIHFSHHIGTTSSAAHECSALNAELSSMFTNAGRVGTKPWDIIVRSHRHRSARVSLPYDDGYREVITTAAFQGKTPYVFRLPAGRTGTCQIGGALVRWGGEELHTRLFVKDIVTVEAE